MLELPDWDFLRFVLKNATFEKKARKFKIDRESEFLVEVVRKMDTRGRIVLYASEASYIYRKLKFKNPSK